MLYLEIDFNAVNQEEDDDNEHEQSVATVENVREEAHVHCRHLLLDLRR